jgi:cellobiose-specific phosphotransferase system component IIB
MGAHHEKCTKRPVQIVGKNVKFRLYRMVQNLYIAGIAISNIDQRDFSKK